MPYLHCSLRFVIVKLSISARVVGIMAPHDGPDTRLCVLPYIRLNYVGSMMTPSGDSMADVEKLPLLSRNSMRSRILWTDKRLHVTFARDYSLCAT